MIENVVTRIAVENRSIAINPRELLKALALRLPEKEWEGGDQKEGVKKEEAQREKKIFWKRLPLSGNSLVQGIEAFRKPMVE